MDYSPPGSSVSGILLARILDWVAILFLGDLPNLGIGPRIPTLQADSLPSEPSRGCKDRSKNLLRTIKLQLKKEL